MQMRVREAFDDASRTHVLAAATGGHAGRSRRHMNRSEGLDHEAVIERSELARHLRGSIFPADRDTVVECAIQEHASPRTLAALRRLPNAVYENVEQVWETLGGEREAR